MVFIVVCDVLMVVLSLLVSWKMILKFFFELMLWLLEIMCLVFCRFGWLVVFVVSLMKWVWVGRVVFMLVVLMVVLLFLVVFG